MENKTCSEIFSERLAELRQQHNETSRDLARALDVSFSAISNYQLGKRTPDIIFLQKVARHYNVSADYLLGLSNAKSTEKDMKIACKVTGLSDLSIYKLQDMARYPYFDIVNNVLEDAEDSYQFSDILKKIFAICENKIKIRAFENAVCELANVSFSLSEDSTDSVIFRDTLIQLQAALNSFYSDTSNPEFVYKKALLFHLPLEEYEIGYNKFLLQSDIMNLIDSIMSEYEIYYGGINGKTIEDIKRIYILELQKIPDVFQKHANILQQKRKESNESISNLFNALFGDNSLFPKF